jgi:hypothetical protein
MYNLTIHFGPNAVAWSFLYKDEDKAGVIYNAYMDFRTSPDPAKCDGTCTLIGTDDYGQTFAIPFEEIRGMLLENTELGTEARILRGLEQAKGQARATKRASTDPELVQAMRGQGPSVITPFANGGFRQ